MEPFCSSASPDNFGYTDQQEYLEAGVDRYVSCPTHGIELNHLLLKGPDKTCP